jgi:hypothetical protein
LEEGAISTPDSVQDLKLENDALAPELAKADCNVEKCRDENIRLRTEAKVLRVELQTVYQTELSSRPQQTLQLVLTSTPCEGMFVSLLNRCEELLQIFMHKQVVLKLLRFMLLKMWIPISRNCIKISWRSLLSLWIISQART